MTQSRNAGQKPQQVQEIKNGVVTLLEQQGKQLQRTIVNLKKIEELTQKGEQEIKILNKQTEDLKKINKVLSYVFLAIVSSLALFVVIGELIKLPIVIAALTGTMISLGLSMPLLPFAFVVAATFIAMGLLVIAVFDLIEEFVFDQSEQDVSQKSQDYSSLLSGDASNTNPSPQPQKNQGEDDDNRPTEAPADPDDAKYYPVVYGNIDLNIASSSTNSSSTRESVVLGAVNSSTASSLTSSSSQEQSLQPDTSAMSTISTSSSSRISTSGTTNSPQTQPAVDANKANSSSSSVDSKSASNTNNVEINDLALALNELFQDNDSASSSSSSPSSVSPSSSSAGMITASLSTSSSSSSNDSNSSSSTTSTSTSIPTVTPIVTLAQVLPPCSSSSLVSGIASSSSSSSSISTATSDNDKRLNS